MEVKDILIIGDSFCSNRTKKYSWPQVLLSNLIEKEYDSKIIPRGKGFSGGAWWAYRKVLLEELKIHVPKVLIICHTEPFRLPNDRDYGINFTSVETQVIDIDNKNYKMPKEVAVASELYYKHLFSFDFYNWSVSKWFEELDQVCENYGIEKVIHFYCFEGDYTNYTFKKGITIDPPLITYAEEPKIKFWKFKSVTINHYTPDGNRLFGEALAKLIKNYPGDGRRITEKMINYGTDSN